MCILFAKDLGDSNKIEQQFDTFEELKSQDTNIYDFIELKENNKCLYYIIYKINYWDSITYK